MIKGLLNRVCLRNNNGMVLTFSVLPLKSFPLLLFFWLSRPTSFSSIFALENVFSPGWLLDLLSSLGCCAGCSAVRYESAIASWWRESPGPEWQRNSGGFTHNTEYQAMWGSRRKREITLIREEDILVMASSRVHTYTLLFRYLYLHSTYCRIGSNLWCNRSAWIVHTAERDCLKCPQQD